MTTPNEWKLVEDLGELRVGMTAKVEPCRLCGKRHCGIVGEPYEGPWRREDGEIVYGPGRVLAGASCFRQWDGRTWISERATRERRTFRLITGNDSSAEQAEGRRDAGKLSVGEKYRAGDRVIIVGPRDRW